MTGEEGLSAKVIGQIALMQSVVSQLPDEHSIMDFVCHGLEDVPGLKSAYYDSSKVALNDLGEGKRKKSVYELKYKNNRYGSLILVIEDEEKLSIYLPFIENLCGVIGVYLEERYQSAFNEELLSSLESRVKQRTQELAREIEIKEEAERSLIESKEQLSFALTAAKSGIWNWDLYTNEIFFSENYYRISGYTPEDFKPSYDAWRNRVHPDDLDYAETAISDYVQGKRKDFSVEFRFKCKDGSWMWILGQGKFYKYEDGKPVRFIGTHTDISSMKRTEEELRNARAYNANIINSMPSILLGVNQDGIINQWNLKAEKAFGISSSDILGKSLKEVLPNLAPEILNIKKAITDKEVIFFNYENRVNEKLIRYEEITIYPLIQNGVEGAVVRIDDVSKQHFLQEQLMQSQKMDAIGQLAGGIAHDFNNMLGGIIGSAEMLATMIPETEDSKLYFGLLSKSAEHASELASKLLAFSRFKSVKSRSIDLSEIINDVVDILKNTIDRRITIVTDIKSSYSLVNGDSALLQSVFLNLGINASQAIEKGGEIKFCLSNVELSKNYCESSVFDLKEGHYIDIEVSDTGNGIPLEDQSRIFEPFFTTKEVGKGTGLGLSAAYGTVRQHKGAITVYSEINRGTVFHIYLPVHEGARDMAVDLGETPLKGIGTILLVDDEEILRKTGYSLLSSCGYKVITASDGQDAVNLFRTNVDSIDLVILDLVMPRMNGKDCFIQLRVLKPSIPIIVSSGFSRGDDIDELLTLGFSGFIEKPFKIGKLSKLVSELI